jgi:hypothetical protein
MSGFKMPSRRALEKGADAPFLPTAPIWLKSLPFPDPHHHNDSIKISPVFSGSAQEILKHLAPAWMIQFS